MLMNQIKQIIIKIREWISRNNILDNVAKGGIYGNVVNSVGGGVVIRGYPMSGR